jgi:Flp pilus assembly pilin Flp
VQTLIKLKKFAKANDGATAIEYAMIAAAMGLGLIPALQAFGLSSGDMWNLVVNLVGTMEASY